MCCAFCLLMGRDDESKPADNREKSEERKEGKEKKNALVFCLYAHHKSRRG